MRFQSYPKYKDAGVEWLGEVPEGWAIVRLKNLLAQRITDGPHLTPKFESEGVPFLSVDGIQDGEINFEGCRFISESDHVEFRKKALPKFDDILMGKAASTGKIARVKVDFEFSIWSPLALIRLDYGAADPGFIEWSLKSPFSQAQIDNYCTANTQKNISMDEIPKLTLMRPPIGVQHAIASFLDRETAKIDALVAEQENLIALLKEKRQAVISHAVTKGLDPTVPMKYSGIEWLGEVPAHWQILKLTKCITSIVDYHGKTPTKVDDGVFLLTARNIRNGSIDYEVSQEFVSEDDYEEVMRRGIPVVGDLLLTMEAPLGQVANVNRTDIAIAQRIIKLQGAINTTNNYYLKWWFMGTYSQAQLSSLAAGSTALGLKASKLGQLDVCLPPREEQYVVEFLDTETAKLDDLTTEAQHTIDLLKERRSALISAAVTGKIDVRNSL